MWKGFILINSCHFVKLFIIRFMIILSFVPWYWDKNLNALFKKKFFLLIILLLFYWLQSNLKSLWPERALLLFFLVFILRVAWWSAYKSITLPEFIAKSFYFCPLRNFLEWKKNGYWFSLNYLSSSCFLGFFYALLHFLLLTFCSLDTSDRLRINCFMCYRSLVTFLS